MPRNMGARARRTVTHVGGGIHRVLDATRNHSLAPLLVQLDGEETPDAREWTPRDVAASVLSYFGIDPSNHGGQSAVAQLASATNRRGIYPKAR